MSLDESIIIGFLSTCSDIRCMRSRPIIATNARDQELENNNYRFWCINKTSLQPVWHVKTGYGLWRLGMMKKYNLLVSPWHITPFFRGQNLVRNDVLRYIKLISVLDRDEVSAQCLGSVGKQWNQNRRRSRNNWSLARLRNWLCLLFIVLFRCW